jgi:hypothetical protein
MSLSSERAQGTPDAGRTREPCVQKKGALRARKKPQGSRNNRRSLRNGLTAYTWSPRCAGLVSHRRLALVTQDLIPASGNRDRTISPYAIRASSCAHRVHRSPQPTSVTIAIRPSHWRGMEGPYTSSSILKTGIFFAAGLAPSGKSDVRRERAPCARFNEPQTPACRGSGGTG